MLADVVADFVAVCVVGDYEELVAAEEGPVVITAAGHGETSGTRLGE